MRDVPEAVAPELQLPITNSVQKPYVIDVVREDEPWHEAEILQ